MKDMMFSKDNPPTNTEEANQRIEQLTLHRRGIDRQLSRASRFGPNSDRHQIIEQSKWRRTALDARHSCQEELDFLLSWVVDREFRDLLHSIGIPDDFFADEGKTAPQQKYQAANPPPSLLQGEERREECTRMKRCFEVGLVSLENASMERKNAGVNFKDIYFALRTRLVRHKARYEEELAFLKFWLKKEHAAEVVQERGLESPEHMLRALALIIRRLKNSGVALPPEDFKTFCAIEAWLAKNSVQTE